mgnify:CR=1 FL=1
MDLFPITYKGYHYLFAWLGKPTKGSQTDTLEGSVGHGIPNSYLSPQWVRASLS